MKPIEIKCPNCGHTIGLLSVRRIRKMVKLLLKNIESLGQFDRGKLDMEIEKMDVEAEAEEIAIARKIERERQEWLNEEKMREDGLRSQ